MEKPTYYYGGQEQYNYQNTNPGFTNLYNDNSQGNGNETFNKRFSSKPGISVRPKKEPVIRNKRPVNSNGNQFQQGMNQNQNINEGLRRVNLNQINQMNQYDMQMRMLQQQMSNLMNNMNQYRNMAAQPPMMPNYGYYQPQPTYKPQVPAQPYGINTYTEPTGRPMSLVRIGEGMAAERGSKNQRTTMQNTNNVIALSNGQQRRMIIQFVLDRTNVPMTPTGYSQAIESYKKRNASLLQSNPEKYNAGIARIKEGYNAPESVYVRSLGITTKRALMRNPTVIQSVHIQIKKCLEEHPDFLKYAYNSYLFMHIDGKVYMEFVERLYTRCMVLVDGGDVDPKLCVLPKYKSLFINDSIRSGKYNNILFDTVNNLVQILAHITDTVITLEEVNLRDINESSDIYNVYQRARQKVLEVRKTRDSNRVNTATSESDKFLDQSPRQANSFNAQNLVNKYGFKDVKSYKAKELNIGDDE